MKQFIIILAILCTCISVQAQDLVQQAENAYKNQNYKEAVSLYSQILDKGNESWQLYYNLGNSYYKIGENAKAILFYERAKLLNPTNADIQYNLQLTESQIADKLEVLPDVFFIEWYNNLISSISANGWSYISIIGFIIFLICAVLFLSSSKTEFRKIFFSMALVALVASIFTFNFAGQQNAKLENQEDAIVMTPSVTAKGAPDANGTNLFVIHEGLKVKVIRKLGEWVSIRLQDGNEGWVKQSDIERI